MRPLSILAAIFLVVAACADDGSDSSVPDSSGDPIATTAPTPFVVPDGDLASVVRVFDGDSFEAEVDGKPVEVRMLGINAPEGFECHGDAAGDHLRDLIEGEDVVLVAEGGDSDDRFGRILRSVYTSELFVNAEMVAEGLALALQGGAPQEELLVELGDIAYANGVGMWAPDACGESGFPVVTILDVEYDPPGRDSENKENEWVVVRNDSGDEVDLSGWILRDESSSHRYEFDPGERLAAGDELRIRTGCGSDAAADRYWCSNDAVWSNGGDTAILTTAAGTVVDRFRYPGDF